MKVKMFARGKSFFCMLLFLLNLVLLTHAKHYSQNISSSQLPVINACYPVYSNSWLTRALFPFGPTSEIKVTINSDTSPPSPLPTSNGWGYLIFENKDSSLIGNSKGVVFCTGSSQDPPVCTGRPPGTLLMKGNPRNPVKYQWFTSDSNPSLSENVVSYPVNQTGFYCLRILNPGRQNINLQVTWIEPYGGLLRPELFPLLVLGLILVIWYALLGVGWAIRHVMFTSKNRNGRRVQHITDPYSGNSGMSDLFARGAMPIQHFMALVIALNFMEMVFYTIMYVHTNWKGSISPWFLFIVMVLGSARSTMSLLVVLLVSLGFGTIRASLGDNQKKLALLTILHSIFSFISVGFVLDGEQGSIADNEYNNSNATRDAFFFFCGVLPGCFTQIIFYDWTLKALHTTITSLLRQGQTAKHAMYKTFYRTLVAFYLISCCMVVVTFIVMLNRKGSGPSSTSSTEDYTWLTDNWRILWFFIDGWPLMLNACAVAVITWVWRPRMHQRDHGLYQLPMELEEGIQKPGLESVMTQYPGTGRASRVIDLSNFSPSRNENESLTPAQEEA